MEATAPELSAQQCVMRAGGVCGNAAHIALCTVLPHNPFAAVFARLIKVLIGEHIFITAKAFTVGNPFRLTSRHSALIISCLSLLFIPHPLYTRKLGVPYSLIVGGNSNCVVRTMKPTIPVFIGHARSVIRCISSTHCFEHISLCYRNKSPFCRSTNFATRVTLIDL